LRVRRNKLQPDASQLGGVCLDLLLGEEPDDVQVVFRQARVEVHGVRLLQQVIVVVDLQLAGALLACCGKQKKLVKIFPSKSQPILCYGFFLLPRLFLISLHPLNTRL
jgi:hypothetical protein